MRPVGQSVITTIVAEKHQAEGSRRNPTLRPRTALGVPSRFQHEIVHLGRESALGPFRMVQSGGVGVALIIEIADRKIADPEALKTAIQRLLERAPRVRRVTLWPDLNPTIWSLLVVWAEVNDHTYGSHVRAVLRGNGLEISPVTFQLHGFLKEHPELVGVSRQPRGSRILRYHREDLLSDAGAPGARDGL